MALVAILLLAIVPTISQIAASLAPPNHHGHHAAAHLAHVGHKHDASDSDDEDCWRKCGYCDFLTHTPALITFAYVAAFAPALAPVQLGSEREQRAYETHRQAAQPRGPPSLLA